MNESQRWALSQLAERCRERSSNIWVHQGDQSWATYVTSVCDDIAETIDAVLEAETEEIKP